MSTQALELPKKPNGSEGAQSLTPMDLLQVALTNNAAIDVIERLAALQEKGRAFDAEMQFNEAMNAAQADLGRVAPNLENPQTHSKYANYAALDRAIRPIYTKHGFSLSFDSGDSLTPDTVRVICYVSHRAGHTRKYQGPPMPADGKGAKGGDVMTKTHATGAAMSYGMRYLLKYIFNVAIGEDDSDGNPPVDASVIASIIKADTFDDLERTFKAAFKANAGNTSVQQEIIAAKDRRKRELRSVASTQGVPVEF